MTDYAQQDQRTQKADEHLKEAELLLGILRRRDFVDELPLRAVGHALVALVYATRLR